MHGLPGDIAVTATGDPDVAIVVSEALFAFGALRTWRLYVVVALQRRDGQHPGPAALAPTPDYAASPWLGYPANAPTHRLFRVVNHSCHPLNCHT